ncbi:MAG: YHS domain-containing protein [Chloroflexota bacterium]|nr:YHS domain-containing protein [Chloroflexota bacterium]
MALDLVCGMVVDEEKADHTSQYQGMTLYFCSPECKAAFDKSPEKYLRERGEGMFGAHEE